MNFRNATPSRIRVAALWRTLLAAALVACMPGLASATIITFDDTGLEHGDIVDSIGGVSITAENYNRAFDYSVIFDSERDDTSDNDLEAKWKGLPRWSGGNLAGETLGNMLILQENNVGCDDLRCDDPDDEGGRAAGELSLVFDVPVLSFGMDLIDVDDIVAEAGSITFEDGIGGSATISFADLLLGLAIGNNTANRISPILARELQLEGIASITIVMGGSGAIDNLNFEPIPEPTTALLLTLGLGGLGLAGRRRHKA